MHVTKALIRNGYTLYLHNIDIITDIHKLYKFLWSSFSEGFPITFYSRVHLNIMYYGQGIRNWNQWKCINEWKFWFLDLPSFELNAYIIFIVISSIFNVINTYHYDYDIGTYRNRINCKIPNQMLITLFMALFRLISVIPISIHNCRMHGPMTKDHHLNWEFKVRVLNI